MRKERRPGRQSKGGTFDLDRQHAPILIVDDRPGNLLSLQSVLEPLGQNILLAKSGDEALRQVLSDDIAVILMDVKMPGLDGIKAAELIRRRKKSAHVPIIFLTAVAIDSAGIARAYEQGAVDFLLKPFEPAILRSKVKVFVDLYLKEKMITRQAALLMQRDHEAFERRSEMQFRSLLDAMPIAVLALRPNGTVYYCNKSVSEWIETSLADERDLSPLEVVCPEDRQRVAAAWRDAQSRGGPLETRFRIQRRSDGVYSWHLCRIVPQRDERGTVSSWICAATDIDHDHGAREQAESANRTKDEFLATVSHELRNPLNAILGWTELLQSGSLDSKKFKRALEIIHRNVRAQCALIDDILDVARVTHGKLRLNLAPTDFAQIVEGALSAVRPLAESKGIFLESRVETSELPVTGDARRLEQILWNLFSNAIKFTHQGGRVRVDLRRNGTVAELTVSDNGQGIRHDFLPHIFDRFRQAEGGSKRSHSGLGLGLAISRELIALHNGSIRADSDGEGKGATFTVTIPLSAAEEALAPERRAPSPRLSLAGIKVLLVDDEHDAREMGIEILTDYGAEVLAASSAREALAVLKKRTPDVLISDIGMPFEDGYDLIRKVRGLDPDHGGRIPACALTGWAATREADRVLAAGFQAHIAKPVDSTTLTQTVYRLAKGTLSGGNPSVPRTEDFLVSTGPPHPPARG